jgi:hypothetical protein
MIVIFGGRRMILFIALMPCRASIALKLSALVSLAALSLHFEPARAQNLVQDPGFESSTGSAASPGWTLNSGDGTSFYDDQTQGGTNAHSGDWAAQFIAASSTEATSGTLSQTIATAPLTTYLISFFLLNQGGPHNTFLATFGGQTVLSLTDSSAFGYTRYTASVTTASRSTSSVLAFTGEQDPSAFYLDDISVVAEAAPSPVAGGGLVSFVALIAGFTIRRMRMSWSRPVLAV